MEAQISAIQAQFEATKEKLELAVTQEQTADKLLTKDREAMADLRKADKTLAVK